MPAIQPNRATASSGVGCIALATAPASIGLSIAALVYWSAISQHQSAPLPPEPSPEISEGYVRAEAVHVPTAAAPVAYAELEIICKKKSGRHTTQTTIAKRVFGPNQLQLVDSPQNTHAEPRLGLLPPYSAKRWFHYENQYQEFNSLENHPAASIAPNWRNSGCADYGVWLVSIPQERYVIIAKDRVWFGSREEQAAILKAGQQSLSHSAWLFSVLALFGWVLTALTGRKLWQNRSRALTEPGAQEDTERPRS